MKSRCDCKKCKTKKDPEAFRSSRKKVDNLVSDLRELGFQVEETSEGELRVSQE